MKIKPAINLFCLRIILPILAFIAISPFTPPEAVTRKNFSKGADATRLTAIQKFRYRFHDSSVPPEYHRSYTIIIKAGKGSITVDSYGEVLGKRPFTVKPEDFAKLKTFFKNARLKARKKVPDDKGCTGGTGESLSVFGTDGREIFKGYVYHCGSHDYADFNGSLEKIRDLIRSIAPTVDSVAP